MLIVSADAERLERLRREYLRRAERAAQDYRRLMREADLAEQLLVAQGSHG